MTSASDHTTPPVAGDSIVDPHASCLNDHPAQDALTELRSMRGTIDNIDAALVHLLAERFKATQRVGVLKARNNFPTADPEREKAQIQRLRALAEAAHLDPEFAEKFLNFIISEVIRHHEAISEDHQRADAS